VNPDLARRAVSELLGTALLVAAVIGSGIAAARLSPHDVGLQLLENSLITGAALVALILALQPVSAAFNPVVTLAEALFGLVGKEKPRSSRQRSGRRHHRRGPRQPDVRHVRGVHLDP